MYLVLCILYSFLAILTFCISRSFFLSYPHTRTCTHKHCFCLGSLLSVEPGPSSPTPLPPLLNATLSGLVAFFMWSGQSPLGGTVACAQSIGDIQDAHAVHALDLMLACLNQVLEYAYRSYIYIGDTRTHEFTYTHKHIYKYYVYLILYLLHLMQG